MLRPCTLIVSASLGSGVIYGALFLNQENTLAPFAKLVAKAITNQLPITTSNTFSAWSEFSLSSHSTTFSNQ
jgi:hypothetical protein